MKLSRLCLPGLFALGLSLQALACSIPPELENQLKLNNTQADKVGAVFEKYRQRMDSLRQQHESNRENDRQQHETLHAEQQKELAALLSADQMKIVEAWQQSHRPPRPDDRDLPGERSQRPMPGGGMGMGIDQR